MPSYTSSSSAPSSAHTGAHTGAMSRAPEKGWLATLIMTVAMLALILGGMEAFWRMQGHRPSINDSMSLWSMQRYRINTDLREHPDLVALVGASRIQLGFNTAAFRDRYPGRPLVNLAIDGSPPVAVLRDLAADPDFTGTALIAITAAELAREDWDIAQSYITRYHKEYKPSVDRKLNTALSLWLQSRVVVLQHSLSLRSLMRAVLKRDLPEPFYLETLPDRSRQADYSKMKDVPGHRAERIRRMREAEKTRPSEPPDIWAENMKEVALWVNAIKARGGKVVFIQFPTTGEHWEIDERRHARALYWDRLADLTGAETLHFQDIQGMAAFDLPDTSHLDRKDTEAFTKLLLDRLEADGILPAP